jgi:hypothetical protein
MYGAYTGAAPGVGGANILTAGYSKPSSKRFGSKSPNRPKRAETYHSSDPHATGVLRAVRGAPLQRADQMLLSSAAMPSAYARR